MSDFSGNDYFTPVGHETWSDIEGRSSGGGGRCPGAFQSLIAWTFIIAGIILAAIFPPLGILIWIGVKIGS